MCSFRAQISKQFAARNFQGKDGVNFQGKDGVNFQGKDGVNFQGKDGVNFHGKVGVNFTWLFILLLFVDLRQRAANFQRNFSP